MIARQGHSTAPEKFQLAAACSVLSRSDSSGRHTSAHTHWYYLTVALVRAPPGFATTLSKASSGTAVYVKDDWLVAGEGARGLEAQNAVVYAGLQCLDDLSVRRH